MSKAADLRKRIDAIGIAMQGTFAARFAKLKDEQKASYSQWRTVTAAYHEDSSDPAATYARAIAGEFPQELRLDIRDALFGAVPTIPADATDAEAAEIYSRFLRRD